MIMIFITEQGRDVISTNGQNDDGSNSTNLNFNS